MQNFLHVVRKKKDFFFRGIYNLNEQVRELIEFLQVTCQIPLEFHCYMSLHLHVKFWVSPMVR